MCREIYTDAFKVNFSAAAEEVAAMFRVRLVPVSAGTPQEMAYAESAVRVIGKMARSLMAGAVKILVLYLIRKDLSTKVPVVYTKL